MGASTDSNYMNQLNLPGTYAPIADYSLLKRAVEAADSKEISVKVGNVLSSDLFYNFDEKAHEKWASMGILAVEMEAAALYVNAAYFGKKALCMLTISDHICTGEALNAEERQLEFGNMIKVALEMA